MSQKVIYALMKLFIVRFKKEKAHRMTVLQHYIQIRKQEYINHSSQNKTNQCSFPITTIHKYGNRTFHLFHYVVNLITEERQP